MPRPKKPAFYKDHFPVSPVQLDPDTRDLLVEQLGLKNEKAKSMIADVEEILTMHQIWIEDLNKSPRPGEKVVDIKAIQEAAQNLCNLMLRLDIYTRTTLYSHVPDKKASYIPAYKKNIEQTGDWICLDSEAECKTDILALGKIIKRSRKAIKDIELHKKQGRQKNNALRQTMVFLVLIFRQYTNDDHLTQRLRDFISLALDAANIPYPDTSDQRTQFDNLLKGR
jgi:hypothetical protein